MSAYLYIYYGACVKRTEYDRQKIYDSFIMIKTKYFRREKFQGFGSKLRWSEFIKFNHNIVY